MYSDTYPYSSSKQYPKKHRTSTFHHKKKLPYAPKYKKYNAFLTEVNDNFEMEKALDQKYEEVISGKYKTSKEDLSDSYRENSSNQSNQGEEEISFSFGIFF